MTNLKRGFPQLVMGSVQGFVMAVALVAAPGVAPVFAQASPSIDPVADQLLRDLGAYIDEADSFTVDVQTEVDELSPRGQKIQYTSSIDLAVRGDDRIHVEETGDLRDRTLWFNGDTFTVLDRDLNLYAVVDTPNNIADAIGYLEDRGVVFALSDFVTGNFYQGVTSNKLLRI